MPTFPERPDLDMETALAQVVSSIAMEELALSHIINAEGEKIQYALGTLYPTTRGNSSQGNLCGGACHSHTLEEILEVNESVKDMLSTVSMNQMFLFAKMTSAMDMYKQLGKKPTDTDPVDPGGGGGEDPTGLVIGGGRILEKDLIGDNSDWIEIATYNGFSLILRTNYINVYDGYQHYGDLQFQSIPFSPKSNAYQGSVLQQKINTWFAGGIPGPDSGLDLLAPDAVLRNYTVQNTVMTAIGDGPVVTGVSTGFSKPMSQKASIGDNVAFALSYGEAANFVSNTYAWNGGLSAPSSAQAQSNFSLITIPSDSDRYNRMWLRSPGNNPDNASELDWTGHVYQIHRNGWRDQFGLVYPALWVDSAVFDLVVPAE